jgi:hypothetical protein
LTKAENETTSSLTQALNKQSQAVTTPSETKSESFLINNIASDDNNLYQSEISFGSNSNFCNPTTSKPKCMGKGCEYCGRILLKIKYINKIGYFCDNCAKDLLVEGLAISTSEVDV